MQSKRPAEFCDYPPRLAPDVEITPRTDSAKPSFIAGSASVGRYLLLGAPERQVVDLLDGTRSLAEVRAALAGLPGAAPDLPELQRFLAKLDEVGMLAGVRASGSQQAPLAGSQFYLRWSLFNPDALFARMTPFLRWIWTPGFIMTNLLLGLAALLMSIFYWPELSRHATRTLLENYVLVFIAAWFVTVTHEMAHGLTSKVFGGRATEVGVLLVYYCLPGVYCNISGLHMIPSRGRRLWVIAAGLYWQLLVGVVALLVWFAFDPQTWLAAIPMAFVLGSLLDIVFNANPLIKLDGYYFLSQWVRIPNLMDRSQALWKDTLGHLLLGRPATSAARFTSRERRILFVFGFFSFLFRLGLPVVIVWYAAQYLMDWFQFTGLLLSGLLALAYLWKPLARLGPFAANLLGKNGGAMADDKKQPETKWRNWRRLVPIGIGVGLVVLLAMPWTASVGSYGALVAIPGREAIIRAPENASLLVLGVQPGQQVAKGAALAQMGNLDVDQELAEARTDLARVNADMDRLQGELRVQRESALMSEWELAQRRREFSDVNLEENQIQRRFPSGDINLVSAVGTSPNATAENRLPPALAALEAETQRLRAQLTEASRQRDRLRSLAELGIFARSDVDAAEGKAQALASELDASQERLSAAMVDHRRRHASTETQALVAASSLSAERAQVSNLNLQLEGTRRLLVSLEARMAVLDRKRGQFALVAPMTGTLFGEDLPRMLGQFFAKGTEICRIADTAELLVRVQVAEQALGDVRVGQSVRIKARTFPDRIFRGAVSNIGGESELDADGQRSYRVELIIQNEEGLLKPGMTVFSRIDFGRRPVAWLLAHKLKQALRPELWML